MNINYINDIRFHSLSACHAEGRQFESDQPLQNSTKHFFYCAQRGNCIASDISFETVVVDSETSALGRAF